MKKIVFVLILCLAVTGCATTGYDDDEMSQYVGYQKDQLIIEFGIPTNEYTLDNGNKIIEYEKIETYSYGPNIATDISSVWFITDPDGIVIDYMDFPDDLKTTEKEVENVLLEIIKQNFELQILESKIYTSSSDNKKLAGFRIKFKNRSQFSVSSFQITVYFINNEGLAFYEKKFKPMDSYFDEGPEILKPNYSFIYPQDAGYHMSVEGIDLDEWDEGNIIVELSEVEVQE